MCIRTLAQEETHTYTDHDTWVGGGGSGSVGGGVRTSNLAKDNGGNSASVHVGVLANMSTHTTTHEHYVFM